MLTLFILFIVAILSQHVLGTDGNIPLGTVNIPTQPLFQPLLLDFGENPLCIPSYAEFEIVNRLKYKLDILSIESSSPYFFPITHNLTLDSFQTIPLQVVFLPHRIGADNTVLNIVTSDGNLTYPMKGVGIRNLYGVQPIVLEGIIGDTFSPQNISVFNPHDDDLHVLELFTTEPFINLVFENHSTMWTIPPGGTKQVISFSLSTTEKPISHIQKGFVYIHTDHDKIVVPVTLMYKANKLALHKTLEFGLVLATTEKKSMDLIVGNNAIRPILLHSIRSYPPDPNLKIDIISSPFYLPAMSTNVKIATLTYTSTIAGKFNGSIILFTNESNRFGFKDEFYYEGEIYTGSISFDESQTVFPITLGGKSYRGISRSLNFKNLFPIPFRFTHVGLTTCAEILNLHENIVGADLSTGSISNMVDIELPAASIVALYNSQAHFVPKTCWLEISTNISSQRIPLHLINGHLLLDVLEGTLLDRREFNNEFGKNKASVYNISKGSIDAANPPDWRFVLVNPNPVPIEIFYANSVEMDRICILAKWPAGQNARSESINLLHKASFSASSKCRSLKRVGVATSTSAVFELNPGQYYLFGANFSATDNSCDKSLQITTLYETIKVGISYTTRSSNLKLELLSSSEGLRSNPFVPSTILGITQPTPSLYHNLQVIIPSHNPWKLLGYSDEAMHLEFVYFREKPLSIKGYPLIYDLVRLSSERLDRVGSLLSQLDFSEKSPVPEKFATQQLVDNIYRGFMENITSEHVHPVQLRFDEAMYTVNLPDANSPTNWIGGAHEVVVELLLHPANTYYMFVEITNIFPWDTAFYLHVPDHRSEQIMRIYREDEFNRCPIDDIPELAYHCRSCSVSNHFLRSVYVRKYESEIKHSEENSKHRRQCDLQITPLDSLGLRTPILLKSNQTVYFGPLYIPEGRDNFHSKPLFLYNNITGWAKVGFEFKQIINNVSIAWVEQSNATDNSFLVDITIRNDGNRALFVTDLDIDGFVCKSMQMVNLGNFWNMVSMASAKRKFARELCTILPIRIAKQSIHQIRMQLSHDCSSRVGGLSLSSIEDVGGGVVLKMDTLAMYTRSESSVDSACFQNRSILKSALLLVSIVCLILLITSVWRFAQTFLQFFRSRPSSRTASLPHMGETSKMSFYRKRLYFRPNLERKSSIDLADIVVNKSHDSAQIRREVLDKLTETPYKKDSIISHLKVASPCWDLSRVAGSVENTNNVPLETDYSTASHTLVEQSDDIYCSSNAVDIMELVYNNLMNDEDDDLIDSPIFEYNGELDAFHDTGCIELSLKTNDYNDDLESDPILNPSKNIYTKQKDAYQHKTQRFEDHNHEMYMNFEFDQSLHVLEEEYVVATENQEVAKNGKL